MASQVYYHKWRPQTLAEVVGEQFSIVTKGQPTTVEVKPATEVSARWSDPGVERVARLLEEVRLNGTRLEF